MDDILIRLDMLRRPHLLICAARIGAEEYRRDIHLPRLLGRGALPRHAPALARLMEMEGALDDSRRLGDASYSSMAHVEVMIAVIGEARILRATRPDLVPPVAPAPAPAPALALQV
jgi:hypothetical protein